MVNTYRHGIFETFQIDLFHRKFARSVDANDGGRHEFIFTVVVKILRKLKAQTYARIKNKIGNTVSDRYACKTKDKMGAHDSTLAVSIVADIRTMRVLHVSLFAISIRMMMNKKSISLSRSCTSSRIICVKSASDFAATNFSNSTPVVQYKTRVSSDTYRLSKPICAQKSKPTFSTFGNRDFKLRKTCDRYQPDNQPDGQAASGVHDKLVRRCCGLQYGVVV